MSTRLGKIIADFETQLATKANVGDTSATLQSFVDDDGIAMPNGAYFLTIDGLNSRKEYWYCQITGGAITSIQSCSRQGALTTGSARVHNVGASVTLTDFANLKIITDYLTGGLQLDSTAPLGYDGTPASLTGNQLATVAYVLSVVTGGTVTFSQQSVTGVLGETVALRGLVYFKASDQRWWNVDADLSATYFDVQMGICLTAGIAGGATTVATSGLCTGFTGLTAGAMYYASNTAGAISTTPGTAKVAVGVAISTTTLYLNPSIYNLPTSDQADALVGSTGVPSTTNKYLTQAIMTLLATAGGVPQLDGSGFIPAAQLGNITFRNGIATRDVSTASGTQTIAHGLGRIPRKISLTAVGLNASSQQVVANSVGAYDGTNNSCVVTVQSNSTGTPAVVFGSTSYAIGLASSFSNPLSLGSVGVVTVDATNITITWSKAGSPVANTFQILWEAE